MLPIDEITELRVERPLELEQSALERRQRPRLTQDGKLFVLAADHPARHIADVGGDPLAMADRRDYLSRIWQVLPAVDGVMATMDVLQELLALDLLIGEGALHEKLLVASLNRGGLAGSAWELDDPRCGATARSIRRWHLDGAKLLMRVGLEDAASLRTIRACAEGITAMNAVGLPTFLEPLVVDGDKKVVREAGAMARLVGVASALGDSSDRLWLKLPWCADFDVVARATTLPILLLGGPAIGDAAPLLDQIREGMAAGANVRGAMVGRNVLYPGDADPLEVARAVDDIIRGGER